MEMDCAYPSEWSWELPKFRLDRMNISIYKFDDIDARSGISSNEVFPRKF